MDRQIIRGLAARYYEIAAGDRNSERAVLYRACNDLKMIRPVVTIDEIPWHEMNIDGELDLKCEDKQLRDLEKFFRTILFKQKHFPCDIYMRTYYPVFKIGHSGYTGGLKIEEKVIRDVNGGTTASHEYKDILKTEEDLEKLQWYPGFYDREGTMKRFEFISDIIGDIIPVKVTGLGSDYSYYATHSTWDHVAQYRGVTSLLTDLIERPEFMHKIARKYCDGYIRSVEEAVRLNLLDPEPPVIGCSATLTNDLAPVTDPDHIGAESTWGRGIAQIFTEVSPAMHDEFDIRYMIESLKPFGLVYYGCCERLDDRIHVLKKMPNLRKIAITPWANVDAAAEIIGSDYEMAVKPNPANVGYAFDEDAIRAELQHICGAAKRNNCSFDITLKDIATVAGKPQNLFRWAQIAMELVNNY